MVSRAAARALQRSPPLYRISRSLWTSVVGSLPAHQVDGIPGRVHPADLMLESRRSPIAVARYAQAGRIAVELLDEAADDLATSSPLDLGCGHGRVTRWLARRVDPSRVTVTDLDPSAVRFCCSEFGVNGFVCSTDPTSLLVTGAHDVVWMGSVITHLDRAAAHLLLSAVGRIIPPGAVVLATQHSADLCAGLAKTMPWLLRRQAELEAGLARDGWAYADYPHHGGGYGLAFATDEAMRMLAASVGMGITLVRRRGWLEQDVWLMRAPEGPPHPE